MALPQEACPYCGEAELIEILEVWPPRDFQLDTCCHGVHEAAVQFLSENPRAAAQWLRAKGLEGLTGRRVRRVIDDGSGQLVLDWRLTIAPVSFSTAKNFVAPHHRHCPAPAGWRFWTGIFNGDELIGCVMVGRPVAKTPLTISGWTTGGSARPASSRVLSTWRPDRSRRTTLLPRRVSSTTSRAR